jgi:hypothetical protein
MLSGGAIVFTRHLSAPIFPPFVTPEEREKWEDPELEVKISFRTSEHRTTCIQVGRKKCVYSSLCFHFLLSFVLSFFGLLFICHMFLFLCLIISLCSFLTSLPFPYLVTVCLLPPSSHFTTNKPFHAILLARILYTSTYTVRISQVPKGLSNCRGELSVYYVPITAYGRCSRPLRGTSILYAYGFSIICSLLNDAISCSDFQ